MITISRFYTTTFTVKRMVYANNRSSESTIGTFKGHLQQAGAELAEQLSMVWTKTFTVWCSRDSDVQVGDTLEYSGNTYSVKAIQDNMTGENEHLELVIEKDE